MRKLFTERHGGAKARIAEELDAPTRDALLNLVLSRIDEEWFGLSFPDQCPDGYGYAGTDQDKLRRAMKGYGVVWPGEVLKPNPFEEAKVAPDDGQVFDLPNSRTRSSRSRMRDHFTASSHTRITPTIRKRAATTSPRT